VQEELNKDMKGLKIKRNQIETMEEKSSLGQIKITIKSHSRRLEQVENRISGLKDKIVIKQRRIFREKTEEL
jgi:hypothetical protein